MAGHQEFDVCARVGSEHTAPAVRPVGEPGETPARRSLGASSRTSSQADGLVLPPVADHTTESDPITACDEAIASYFATGPRLVHGGSRACYVPSRDVVLMPERSSFDGPEAYYDTLFHEATHSTGHRKRLARQDLLEFHAFGDPSYSREELVAEMGAAFLSGHTGIALIESVIDILKRPTRPRTPRRTHHRRHHRPHRPTRTRPNRRHLAQPHHRTTHHPITDRLRPLISYDLLV